MDPRLRGDDRKFFFIFIFACSIFLVSGVHSPVYARGEECNKCEQDSHIFNPNQGFEVRREWKIKNCYDCVAPLPGNPLYCWCKPAADPSKGLCENHTKKDSKGDGPFQNGYDCKDYCESLGNGRSAEFIDFSYIDRNKDALCQAPKPGAATAPAGSGSAGSPTVLYNPLGQDVNLFALIGRLIRSVIGIVGALALLMFIYGGILWMTSGGSETQVKRARGILINSTIGLLIIFFSYTIISLFFGLFAA
ncbi:MAG: pilin [Candidatus Uhrbacteria bacterium]|nr:pilin [Candidatus Uhrbacteria bacterium]